MLTYHNRNFPKVLVSTNRLVERCEFCRPISQVHLHIDGAKACG